MQVTYTHLHVSIALRVALADANLLAIRRLLSRATSLAHTITSPGPPLLSTHPSPSLLAKLHLNIYNLYDEARALCKSASDPTTSGELDSDVRKYIATGRSIALALSYKWLGIDAGENGGKEKVGEAICWLTMAKNELEMVDAKVGSGLDLVRISKEEKKIRRGKLGTLIDGVNAFLNAYRKVNDAVSFVSSFTSVSLPIYRLLMLLWHPLSD